MGVSISNSTYFELDVRVNVAAVSPLRFQRFLTIEKKCTITDCFFVQSKSQILRQYLTEVADLR